MLRLWWIWCVLLLAAWALAEPARVDAPLVASAAESAAAMRQALATGRCYAVETKYGVADTLLHANSPDHLPAGRYRAHFPLALGPLGAIDLSAIAITLTANDASRAVTMLHFAKADEFTDLTLDFTAPGGQTADLSIAWALTGERAKFYHEQALRGRAAEDPDAKDDFDMDLDAPPIDRDGTIALADLGKLPFHLAACGVHIEALAPVMVTKVAADKIVYKPGETGTATVIVKNTGAAAAQAALTVELGHGLTGTRPVATATIALAPGETKTWTGPFETNGLHWGVDLRASVQVGNSPAATKRFACGVTNNPWEVALVSGMMFSRDYIDPARAEAFMQRHMDNGFTGLESGFWAPDEFGDFTPDPVRDIFFGGQHCYPGSVKGTKNVIAAGHKRGMACTVYANLWGGDGYDGWEMIRQHPDWIAGGSATYSDMLENWDLMFAGKLQMACWPYVCNNGGGMEALTMPVHARELVNTKREIGWDGVRYDSYDAEGEWNINCTETVRRLVEKDEPNYLWGYNSSVPKNVTARALDVMCRGGALVMEEGLRGAGKAPSSITGYLTTLAGYRDKVWAHGGHLGICYDRPMATLSYGGSVVDELYLSSSLLAAGAHPYYGVIENTLGQYPRFALRYSEFIYDNRLRELAAPEAVISLPTTATLLAWPQLAKIRDLGENQHRLVVHLLNTPADDMTQRNLALKLPAPLRNLPVTLTLPAGAKVTGAWTLSPIPDAHHSAVPVTMNGRAAVVTVQEVRIWNVLVVEFTAPDGLPTKVTRATGEFRKPEPVKPKPPVVPEPDDVIAKKQGIVPPADWVFPTPRPLRVLNVRGFWYPTYGMDRIYARLGGVWQADAWHSATNLRYFPDSYEEFMRNHLVVVGNTAARSWGPARRAMLRRFVEEGGAVLFLGGKYAYGADYRHTAFAEMAPVLFDETVVSRHAAAGEALAAGKDAPAALRGLAWGKMPRVYWYHALTPKPDAKVLVTAGGTPLLITGTYGKGRVAVFAGSVMGVPDAGQLPCWEWEDWPALLANTISWLVEPATQPRPPSPELLAKMRAELLGPGVKKAESHGKAITRYARIPGGTDSTLTLLKAVSILDGDVPPDLADTVWDSVRPTLSAAANAVARDLLTGAASAKKSLGLRALGQMQTADARALLEEAFKNPDAGGPDDDLEGGMQETITEDPAVAAVTIRLGALEGLGNLGNPAALPLLKNAVRQYQRVMTNPANLAREVTPEDELYHEAVLSALRCGDVSAAAPVVDMLLENRYVFIRMMSFLDGPDYPGPEHEATRREKRRIIRELPRVYRRIARLHAKLNSLPSAVLPALAKRIAAEEDHRVAPIAFAIFGANGKPSPDVLAILRAAKVPAVRELANIP